MLADELWLPRAKLLTVGQRARMKCCGKDNSLLIGCGTTMWWAKCYRCGGYSQVPRGALSLKELKQKRDAEKNFISSPPTLPRDFTASIPRQGRLWLYSASIYGKVVQTYGIGWSDSMRRVIIPVYSCGRLVAVVARSVDKKHKPKYLTQQEKAGTVFESKCAGPMELSTSQATIVVVEDILSAIRCGEFLPTVSILGTWVNSVFLNHILQVGAKRVICWYDNDPAGFKATAASRRALTLQGVDVRTVRTDKDPKKYSNVEIASILKGVL